ncbi:MAG: hypothetical protein B7Y36_16565 [Novosphingobium sp. 28-62-57]|uniref:hypothetical protein n=1 Tax=unclassified Novosphingobium TaxID=2644732 RepID=UPI000BDB7A70|nr:MULTISPECIES: hypothetical protein [unclassified Novosphingobium]OYW48106.1 MAG: hypothetical protein B7Z36_00085 [Novosphingobium sp. 12-63-9]OYZ08610.1 MAG: hypothetical protein B7Y36_16565 [Novosphingobium sp. 28-62-57]OZA36113.1 MAG: hypothetical protein B7X92_07630 [Novosphingobium sp. 17-62-9]HQS69693.1 hypothetical protein [Novosphingobium sp.]
MIRLQAAAALALLATPALAQTEATATVAIPTAVPAPVMIIAPAPTNVLRAGTEIPLITREELTTKKKQVRVGQRVQLEVASNVTANGLVIIPVGTPAVGEVTEVRNKGMWGKSGYIAVRMLSMRLGDRQFRLSGTFDDKGVTGTGGVVASVALIPLAGFFTTGTSANIPSGSGAKGFLEEDITYAVPAAVPPAAVLPVATQTPANAGN